MATTDRLLPFVQETSSTTGTGTLTLSGAVSGYRTVLTAFGGSAIMLYTLANSTYSKWEVGYGTVSGATLTRNLLVSSTGSLIDFTGSTPFNVYVGSVAYVLNSLMRLHFGSSRPAWLPANAPWVKDAGSNIVELYWYDGTDDIKLLSWNVSTNFVTPYATDGTFTVSMTDAGAAVGPTLYLDRISSSPAANDLIGAVYWRGRDSGGNATDYADMSGYILDPTNGSEDGGMDIASLVAGSRTVQFGFRDGVVIGTITYRGSGKLAVQSEVWCADQQIADTLGLLRNRSYTIATKPAAGTATRQAYVSDGASNKRLMVDDGAAWRYPDGVAV